jgi:HK97 family phage portal protein
LASDIDTTVTNDIVVVKSRGSLMETLEQREERIGRLEERRAGKQAQTTVWPTPDDAGTGVIPLEIAPGRGDLNYSAGFVPTFPTSLYLVGMRAVSFARLFMSQPWIAAAVMRMMTWAIRVPLKVYRRDGDDPADRVKLRADEHPLAAAVAAPWNRASQVQLVMAIMGPLLVHGNGLLAVDSGANDSIGFTPKDWRFTRPLMPFRDTIAGFQFDVDSPAYRSERSVDEVVHVAYWSPTGPIGCSPLQQLGTTLQIEDAAQRYQRSTFTNGASPMSMITMSEQFLGLKPEERERITKMLRSDVAQLHGGPDNAGKPALLPPGLDWKVLGQTTVEAALVDQRKVAREEVAAVYMIPPPLLGILDRATYSNIQVQRDMTYTECVGPPLVLIEQAINSQIARDLLKEPEICCEFDFGAVLRGDRLQEIAALRDGIGSALMTPNEGRSVLNLAKSEDTGMDSFYLPVNNLQPVGSPPQPAGSSSVVIPNPSAEPTRGKRLHVRSRDSDYDLELADR